MGNVYFDFFHHTDVPTSHDLCVEIIFNKV